MVPLPEVVEKHRENSEAAQRSATAESHEYPEAGGTEGRAVEPDLWS